MKTDDKKLSREEILHIAKLARVEIRDQEIERFQDQLSQIIAYIGKLNEVNTDNIIPTNQVSGLVNKTREDTEIVEDGLSSNEALQNAPHKKDSLFQVEAVFEEE